MSWAILLLAFFVSSSALSYLAGSHKTHLIDKIARGSRRDAAQVLANGGLAAFLVMIFALVNLHIVQDDALTSISQVLSVSFSFSRIDQPLFFLAFAASLAAANADTWSTEIGVLSHSRPILITSGRPVERGTSGGISILGIFAGLGGAALIGFLASMMIWVGFEGGSSPGLAIYCVFFLVVTIGGLAGSLIDSLLGATLQVIYFCPHCNKGTERHPYHTCGAQTIYKQGWRWFNNDWVNLACTVSAAMAAALLGLLSIF